MKLNKYHILIILLMFITLLMPGCAGEKRRQVVVYTSVDQNYAEPILAEFEKKTGIKVLPVYDVEAAKTTGLVNRLIAEKERPVADVFWNSEFVQTMLLKDRGILAPYQSSSAAGIPQTFRDAGGYWAGFGGRARVLLVNTNLVKPRDYPASVFDLSSEKWRGDQIGIAYPVFGTSATHAAALYALFGPEKGKGFYEDLRNKGVQLADGNSVVRDLVVQGRLAVGLTDTDDADQAVKNGSPVKVIFPDQDSFGTLVIPNTVALIKGAPNPDEAKVLIEYLLGEEVENELVASGFIQFSLRSAEDKSGTERRPGCREMDVDFEKIYANLEPVKTDLANVFIR